MCIVQILFGLILLVAQRCIPTIFDVDDLTTLILTNDANVSNETTTTALDELTLQDIEDGTV